MICFAYLSCSEYALMISLCQIGNIFNRESLWGLYPRILRFFTMFEKKEFNDFTILLSSEIISSFSTDKICSFETILSERKGFTVFQKFLSSLTSFFHLNCCNNFSLSFLAVKHNNFFVMCIVVCFHQLFILKTYCEA